MATLVARQQTSEMPYYFELALDNGVTPREISEAITHLAFYGGWANAMSAVSIAKDVFDRRRVDASQLPAAAPDLLPVDVAAEATRAASVQENIGPVSQGLVDYTGDLLFNELWLRPGLAPRDRSLVTVAALTAAGHSAQLTFHLNRAMDHGLTQEQAGEALAHLAFYAGWPYVFSAGPVFRQVFESRRNQS